MLIPICILLAASPVSASLLPQRASVHLLDTAALPAAEGLATQNAPASKGGRITAEAIGGMLGGIGLGVGGALLGAAIDRPSDISFGLSGLGMLLAFIGIEAGEMLGVGIPGFGLGAKGSGWSIVLGNLAGLAASALVGSLVTLAVVSLGLVGAILGVLILVAVPVAGEIIALEMFSGDQPPPAPSTQVSHPVGQTAALAIHF